VEFKGRGWVAIVIGARCFVQYVSIGSGDGAFDPLRFSPLSVAVDASSEGLGVDSRHRPLSLITKILILITTHLTKMKIDNMEVEGCR